MAEEKSRKEVIEEAQTKLEEIIESNKKKAKESVEYQEMMKHFKKTLSDINKKVCKSPWEPDWVIDYFVEFLRFMQRYYELGINVWAMERKDEDPKRYKNYPTRYESITQALAYYDKLNSLEDEYIHVNLPDDLEDLFEPADEDGCRKYKGADITYKYGPKNNKRKAMKITYKKLYKEQLKYKKLFTDYVVEHMHEWWD